MILTELGGWVLIDKHENENSKISMTIMEHVTRITAISSTKNTEQGINTQQHRNSSRKQQTLASCSKR